VLASSPPVASNIAFFIDHLGVQSGLRRLTEGKGIPRHRRHQDLWLTIGGLLRSDGLAGKVVTATKVKAHPTSEEIARADHIATAFLANASADRLAKQAAASLPDREHTAACWSEKWDTAVAISERIAAILRVVQALPVPEGRQVKPPPAARPSLAARLRSSEHKPWAQGEGRYRCTRCLSLSPKAGTTGRLRRWLGTSCLGVGTGPKGPHPSHQLARWSFGVWCRACGAWAHNVARRLRQPCPGEPPSAQARRQLRQLRRGRMPRATRAAEQPLDVPTLEVAG